MKSFIISPFTMPAALSAGNDLLGNPRWVTTQESNSAQGRWLETYPRRAAESTKIPEIHRNATRVVADHVAFLQKHGWKAQITQGAPSDLFLASVLDILNRWRMPGHPYQEQGIDRAVLKHNVRAGESSQIGTQPIVLIETQTADVVWLHQLDHDLAESPEQAIEHALKVMSINGLMKAYVDFPMIDLKTKSSAEYMLGLHTEDGGAVVTQAAEQFHVQMNHLGARGQAAAEIAVMRSMSLNQTPTIKIDGPFMAVIQRSGLSVPPVIAVCAEDAWKAPPPDAI